MKVTFKTAHGYLSAQPPTPGGLVRWQYRQDAGPWESFELEGFDFPVPPVPPTPTHIDPIDGIWPPPPGTPKTRPPDVATTNPTEVKRQLRWSLWVADSNDDESYWMNAIVLTPEPGHPPGWTNDPYCFEKVKAGDGASKGYVWPPK